LKYLQTVTVLVLFSLALTAASANTAIQTTTFNFTPGTGNESWSNNNANSGILTLSFSNPNLGTIILTGYSCPQTLCNQTPQYSESALKKGLTDVNGALGIYDNPNFEDSIPRNTFVTVDFSNFKAPIANITINMTNVVDGWDIYSTTVANQLDSLGGNPPAPLAQANNGWVDGLPTTANSTITQPFWGVSTGTTSLDGNPGQFLTITALQADCEVEIASMSVSYAPAPEPSTYFLTGIALIALGVAGKQMRERRR